MSFANLQKLDYNDYMLNPGMKYRAADLNNQYNVSAGVKNEENKGGLIVPMHVIQE